MTSYTYNSYNDIEIMRKPRITKTNNKKDDGFVLVPFALSLLNVQFLALIFQDMDGENEVYLSKL
jgi:hypothetical protein